MTLFISPRICRRPVFAFERDFHDLGRDALDLDVHLQCRDAVFRSGHFEIHVAQMIFVTQDVGEHLVALAFEHEPHGNARDRRLERNTRVHHGERCAAYRSHRRGAVGLENFGHYTNDVRELLHVRHHGSDTTTRKVAVTDLATLRS